MDTDGFILHINETFIKSFGYREKDIVGKPIRVLFTEEDQKKNLPDRELLNVKEKGSSIDNNYLVNKNGALTWVAGESVLVKDNDENFFIIKLIQNIHEQKQLENFLLESNNFAESILNNIADIIVVIDRDMRILKVNRSFTMQYELSGEDIEGMNLSRLFTAENAETFHEMFVKSLTPGAPLIENEIEIKTGKNEKKTFLVNASILEHHLTRDNRILLIMHDITADKLLNQQREDLISFVSHELRNPLTNLFMFTELLQDQNDKNSNEINRQYLQKMNANLQRLNNIVKELYDSTKAAAGQMQLEKTNFSMRVAVDEAIDAVNMIQSSHRILKEGDLDIVIHADKYRLIQVITNYLSNAVKYSPESDKVLLRVQLTEGKLILSVTDFGNGISHDKIAHVFARFFRAETKTEGVGLGLYLSREIIKSHKGEVWVESQIGKGSTFYFEIPCPTTTGRHDRE